MAAAKLAVALVVLAVVFVAGIGAMDASLSSNTVNQTTTNESFTPIGNTTVELANSNLTYATYYDNETIRFTNGTIVTSGGNYTWNAEGNGTVKVVNNSRLSNVSTALATYSYDAPTPEARGVGAMMAGVFDSGGAIVLGLAAFALLAALGRMRGA